MFMVEVLAWESRYFFYVVKHKNNCTNVCIIQNNVLSLQYKN